MNSQNLAGKDSPLGETIKRFEAVLKNNGIAVKVSSQMESLNHHHSCHLVHENIPAFYSNGKGTSPESAYASALGEFIERWSTGFYFSDFKTKKEQFFYEVNELALTEDNFAAKIPEEFLGVEDLGFDSLLDSKSGEYLALPFKERNSQNTSYIPVSFLNQLYLSNGMSAGNTLLEAKVQALSEIVERYVKRKVIEESLRLPAFSEEILRTRQEAWTAIEELQRGGFEVRVLDASLGGLFPVVAVAILNKACSSAFVSFGAHPSLDLALERTLTELVQGRKIENFHEFQAPTWDENRLCSEENWEHHFVDSSGQIPWSLFENHSEFEFSPCHLEGSREEEYEFLCDLIEEQGFRIFEKEYSPLGVSACRIVIPGLSEIYGMDCLPYLDAQGLLAVQTMIEQSLKMKKSEKQELLELLVTSEQDDATPLSRLLELAGDDEPRLGDLKLFLALQLEHWELALSVLEWKIHAATDGESVRHLYHFVASNVFDHDVSSLVVAAAIQSASTKFQSEFQDVFEKLLAQKKSSLLDKEFSLWRSLQKG